MADTVKVRRIVPSTVIAHYTLNGAPMKAMIGERGIVDVDRSIAELWLEREVGEWEIVKEGTSPMTVGD